jgi:transcriptional regulator with XRE-family HTH domain
MYSDGTTGPGDLGRRIVARRQHLGWSREQLAVRAGLSVSYLTHVETHPAVVTMACLVGLADALGTTVGALLGAGATGQDGATATPTLADLWIPTGTHGERPGPFLG